MPFKRFLIHDTDYGTAVSNGFNETSGFVSATSGGISQVKKPRGVTQNNTLNSWTYSILQLLCRAMAKLSQPRANMAASIHRNTVHEKSCELIKLAVVVDPTYETRLEIQLESITNKTSSHSLSSCVCVWGGGGGSKEMGGGGGRSSVDGAEAG